MEDCEIVALYLGRDETAIQQTKEKYGSKLRSFSFSIVRDYQMAEECENDTYLRAWNSIPPHDPRAYFYPFLARIIRNLSLNCCRDQERMKRNIKIVALGREMEQCIPSPGDTASEVDAAVLKEAINCFLQTLDTEKRNVFLRRYWYMDSIDLIAKRYGISNSKVKVMLFRIRNQMKDFLQKEGYDL